MVDKTELKDVLSFEQMLMVINPETGEVFDVSINIDDLLEKGELEVSTINENKTVKVSDDTKMSIISWLHEKTIHRLELLETGEVEDREEKVLNLSNWQRLVSQSIMIDLFGG
jgi:hypothetical protein